MPDALTDLKHDLQECRCVVAYHRKRICDKHRAITKEAIVKIEQAVNKLLAEIDEWLKGGGR